MMRGYVKSNPHFFRRIKLAMALVLAILLILAAVIPVPLQEPANIALVPNPVRSAWFLLWIQEIVSYSKYLAYAVVLLAAFFILLPWLPGSVPARDAGWWRKDQSVVNTVTVTAFAVIVALTIVAMFFRGRNWDFIAPF